MALMGLNSGVIKAGCWTTDGVDEITNELFGW